MNKLKKIAVHNGVFHGDDVVAVAACYLLYGCEVQEVLRIPARDDDAQKAASVHGYTLVDVGGGQFDHHSVAARENTYHNGVIKSAVGKVLEQAVEDQKISAAELNVLLANGLYALQAQDNGQDFQGEQNPFGFVQWLNTEHPNDDEAQWEAFCSAVGMSIRILTSMLKDAKNSIPNHLNCILAFEKMENGIADFPHYMAHGVLECQMWNSDPENPKVKFFTFPQGDGTFRIQAVNKPGSFALEYELPYKGLRNDDLNEAAGIKDGIFVHPNGFIAGASSIESCHKFAAAAQ